MSLDINFAKYGRMISMHMDSKCHGNMKKRLKEAREKFYFRFFYPEGVRNKAAPWKWDEGGEEICFGDKDRRLGYLRGFQF